MAWTVLRSALGRDASDEWRESLIGTLGRLGRGDQERFRRVINDLARRLVDELE